MLSRIVLAAIMAIVAVSCGGPTPAPTASPIPAASPTTGTGSPLGVANGTTVPVSVAVNGSVVETVPAGPAAHLFAKKRYVRA